MSVRGRNVDSESAPAALLRDAVRKLELERLPHLLELGIFEPHA